MKVNSAYDLNMGWDTFDVAQETECGKPVTVSEALVLSLKNRAAVDIYYIYEDIATILLRPHTISHLRYTHTSGA
jgi:hypothetical protein